MYGPRQTRGSFTESDRADESHPRAPGPYHTLPLQPYTPLVSSQTGQYQPPLSFPIHSFPAASASPSTYPQSSPGVDRLTGWVPLRPYVTPGSNIPLHPQPPLPHLPPPYPQTLPPRHILSSHPVPYPAPVRTLIYSPNASLRQRRHTAPSEPQAATHSSRSVQARPTNVSPPSGRSKWAMWVGNIPSDTTKPELLQVFSASPGLPSQVKNHVHSVHLISRSNCAFVNYDSQAALEEAVLFFSGRPFRIHVLGCPRMSCRIRTEDDDTKFGKGVQRRRGMHMSWVKQRSKDPAVSERGRSRSLAESAPGDGSDTQSSTSSLLEKNFPDRYFVLKSLNLTDLDISVEKGIWATQQHNENILDRAYRTSQNVYLIFSANKSGEFFGYARMASPILPAHEEITQRKFKQRTATETPLHPNATNRDNIESGQDLDNSLERSRPHSDPQAQLKPASRTLGSGERHTSAPPRLTQHADRLISSPRPERLEKCLSNEPNPRPKEETNVGGPKAVEEGKTMTDESVGQWAQWGHPFKIEWVHVKSLSFTKTRHLRNAWNNHQEIKVSRDGTELEPEVGRSLLEEWTNLYAGTSQTSASLQEVRGGNLAEDRAEISR